MDHFPNKSSLAILLGTESWPRYGIEPDLIKNGARFGLTADLAHNFLCSPDAIDIKPQRTLNLFNSKLSSASQLRKIKKFLKAKVNSQKNTETHWQDIIIYFIGFFCLSEKWNDVQLLVNKSNRTSSRSKISFCDLIKTIEGSLPSPRLLLIVDGSWHNHAGANWDPMDPSQVAHVAIANRLRRIEVMTAIGLSNDIRGMLCEEETFTSFTKEFFGALLTTPSPYQEPMTLDDLSYQVGLFSRHTDSRARGRILEEQSPIRINPYLLCVIKTFVQFYFRKDFPVNRNVIRTHLNRKGSNMGPTIIKQVTTLRPVTQQDFFDELVGITRNPKKQLLSSTLSASEPRKSLIKQYSEFISADKEMRRRRRRAKVQKRLGKENPSKTLKIFKIFKILKRSKERKEEQMPLLFTFKKPRRNRSMLGLQLMSILLCLLLSHLLVISI